MSEIVDLKRRSFLKGSAAVAAGAGLAASSSFALSAYEEAENAKKKKEEDIKKAKFTPSVCGMCVNMCSVVARNVDGKVYKIDPNPLNPKNRDFMCARGNAGIAAAYDPDRLKTPLIRVGKRGEGKFRKATWEEAFEFIRKKLVKIIEEEKDNRSTVIFGAGASTGNMGEPMFQNLVNGVGGFFIDHFSTCFAPSFLANKMIFGSWGSADFQRSKYVLTFGGNRTGGIVTPDTLDMFRRTHKRGMKLVYIDPRFSNTAAHADEYVPIKAGTDGAMLLAMIHETINKGYHKTPYKAEYLAKNVSAKDLAELEEFFTTGEGSRYTPEWAEKITDVPAATIRRLTKEFSDAAEKYKGAANCYRSRKSTWYYQDFDYRRAQAIFNVLHGTVNRPGGVLLGRGLKAEKYEIEEWPIFDNAKPRLDVAYAQSKGGYPLVNPTKGSWQLLRDAILEVNTKWKKGEKLADWEYPIRAGFFYKQNPMQSVPGLDLTAKALDTMDLVVVIDIIPNDTAFYADVILPDASYLEWSAPLKSFGGQPEPAIVARHKAMEPLYKTKNIRDILKGISEAIEKDLVDIAFKYNGDLNDALEEEGKTLPKDFKISKYFKSDTDWEIDEDKLKADIKDEKLVEIILENAGEDGMDITTFRISRAFEKTVEEFNEEVMEELYGKEAAEILKEYGVWWPGIEDAIKDGLIDEHTKSFKKDLKDKHEWVYNLYKKYNKLKKNDDGTPFFIVPKKGKWIKIALRNIHGKEFVNPITGKKEKLHKFPMWREELTYQNKKGEFRMIMGRHSYFTQSAHPNNYLLLDLMNYNYVWINEKQAKEMGLKFKDEVELKNREGVTVRGKVYPTKKIKEDTVFIATGFGSESNMLTLGYHNGVSQAKIQENCIDPIIGSSSMNETFVSIRKV
ncbi:MAG: molybdopterin-dependent oxidoreductase [Epsilonproteobacteria bacterium]|nr:molybdopterin-dependent oxidoreductase [Campylobacterota bacterium]